MKIVHEREHRRSFGGACQKGEGARVDREALRRRRRAEGERSAKGFGLAWRDSLEVVEQRTYELVKPAEREVRIGFHAPGAQNSHSGSLLGRIGEEGALSDAGLAADDEGVTPALAERFEDRVDARALEVPADDHAMSVGRCAKSMGISPKRAFLKVPRLVAYLETSERSK